MKIVDLKVELFRWDAVANVRYGAHSAARGASQSCLALVSVLTDEGVKGHSFLGAYSRSAELDALSLVRALKPMVVGEDPLDRERLLKRMMQRIKLTTYRAVGAVDVALWDLAGKVAGLPVYKLMGAFRDSVPAYASSEVLGSVGDYVEQAQRMKAEGWKAYKIHPPADWREDIAICKAVREAVGGDYPLMLDSTWSYTYEETIRVGRAIQDLDYYWYEDPLPPEDLLNYVKVKQQLHIPIVATEYSAGGFAGFAPWIVNQATDVLRGDPAVKGGLTACLKAAHLAEAFGMNFEIHHGGNSLNNVANLHLMCAIRNSEFFEVLLPDEAQKYGLVEDIKVGPDGMLKAPSGPGLGVEIDFDLIRHNFVADVV
ncbi:enolase C-terminal domain-like protein [Ancylobacter mangrovi]|uniref:enolase C-terminal domain-like protein n=1 Tax=Ancylobacter mangrovi TaxID=2972472 RepID=UPI002161950C|nr:enolase C-terminal domain-like protein [Ancylobacter mangrovi]MCS0505020.1 mandelate racemase [Ancylobacter mangrovi]